MVITGVGIVNTAVIGGSTALTAYLEASPPAEPAVMSNEGGASVMRLRPSVLGDLINEGEGRRLSRVCQLAVAAARLALADAALPSRDGLGLVVGSEFGDLRSSVEFADGYLDRGPAGLSALLFPNTVMNTMAAATAIALAIKEVSLTLNAPTIAGELAIARAAAMIGAGRLTAALAGGVDEIDERLLGWLVELGATRGVRGEGATFLVLESGTAAGARGARVLGEIRGVASGALSAPPWGIGRASASRTIADALRRAETRPEEVRWGYASVSGDSARDRWEDRLLATALRPHRPPIVALAPLVGEHAGLGGFRVAAGAWTARTGLVPRVREIGRAGNGNAPAIESPRVGPGSGIVHGIARGGAHVTLVIGPPA